MEVDGQLGSIVFEPRHSTVLHGVIAVASYCSKMKLHSISGTGSDYFNHSAALSKALDGSPLRARLFNTGGMTALPTSGHDRPTEASRRKLK